MGDFFFTAVDAVTLFVKTLINPDYLDQLAAGETRPSARIHTTSGPLSSSGSASGNRPGGGGLGGAGGGHRPMGTIGGTSFRPSGVTPSMCSGGSCG